MSERIKRLQVNFDIPGAPINQRSAKFAREMQERNPDRFGKPKNKSEKAELRRQLRRQIGGQIDEEELFEFRRALVKVQNGTATPEDRGLVLKRAGIIPTNGLNGDSEIFES